MKKVDSRKVASLRGSEATEAIHKNAKADSSVKVDRHAVQAPLAMTKWGEQGSRVREKRERCENEKTL